MSVSDAPKHAQDNISKLENELSQHQRVASHLSRIFASLPVGIMCTDSQRRILEVNPGIPTLLGYREEELIGRQTDFLYSDKKSFEQLENLLLNRDAEITERSFETNFRKKDGTIFPVEIVCTPIENEDGKKECYLKILRDVGESKATENHLRRMERKFRLVADYTYDWEVWALLDHSFLYVSPSCKRISGYSVEQFMDTPALFREIIHPDDKQIWDDHLLDSDNLRIDQREIQFRILRRDGEIRWIEHACQRVKGDNNELLGFRSSNRDITQRKTTEEELRQALKDNLKYEEQLEAESAYLREEMKLSYDHTAIIGGSNALQYVLFKIEQIAPADTTVLLLGETGTGKELFARAIHNTSRRKDRPLIKINCATLPANLIESELFGHEKGSFTGAHARRIGRFELADKATIFLDEIGELPLELQAKLLRVLQEGEFERLGGSRSIKVDVRVITATNRDLETDVNSGNFRKDLWYRLNVFPITAPPLRDRYGDIQQLVRHFVELFGRELSKNIKSIPVAVMKQLEEYPWPGNIRELENVIERAVLNTSGSRLNLADELKCPQDKMEASFQNLEDMERDYISRVLEETNWKVSGRNSASEILGLKRGTLRAKMDKYGISRP